MGYWRPSRGHPLPPGRMRPPSLRGLSMDRCTRGLASSWVDNCCDGLRTLWEERLPSRGQPSGLEGRNVER